LNGEDKKYHLCDIMTSNVLQISNITSFIQQVNSGWEPTEPRGKGESKHYMNSDAEHSEYILLALHSSSHLMFTYEIDTTIV
jgi:hypothetical protein